MLLSLGAALALYAPLAGMLVWLSYAERRENLRLIEALRGH